MPTASRKPLTTRPQNVEMPPALRSGKNAPTEKVEKAPATTTKTTKTTKRAAAAKKAGASKKAAAVKMEPIDLDMAPPAAAAQETDADKASKVEAGNDMEDLAKLFGQTSISSGGTMVRRPARPQTGYQLFVTRQKAGEVDAKAVWKELSEVERNDFNEDPGVTADKQRYAREMEEYNRVMEMMDEEKRAVEFAQRKMFQQRAMKFYLEHLERQPDEAAKMRQLGGAASKAKSAVEMPKKARSAYVFFVMENQGKGDAKDLGEMWKKVKTSKSKKNRDILARCEKKAAEDALRFRDETEAYQRMRNELTAEKEEQDREFRREALTQYREATRTEEDAKKYRELMQKGGTKVKGEAATESAESAESAGIVKKNRRGKTAYNVFMAEKSKEEQVRKRAAKEGTTPFKLVSQLWRELDDGEKRGYEELAQIENLAAAREAGSAGQ